jgi:ketosteroid isomerase-like protein
MDLDELKQKLATMESREEIMNLTYEYMNLVNACQVKEMLDIYANNATAICGDLGPYHGKAEIAGLFKKVIPSVPLSKPRDAHFLAQPVISVKGDKAEGHWLMYILIPDPATGYAHRWVQNKLDIEYIKISGKWKFQKLHLIPNWPLLPVVKT